MRVVCVSTELSETPNWSWLLFRFLSVTFRRPRQALWPPSSPPWRCVPLSWWNVACRPCMKWRRPGRWQRDREGQCKQEWGGVSAFGGLSSLPVVCFVVSARCGLWLRRCWRQTALWVSTKDWRPPSWGRFLGTSASSVPMNWVELRLQNTWAQTRKA